MSKSLSLEPFALLLPPFLRRPAIHRSRKKPYFSVAMDPQSTQFQQAQLAMVLGPDPSHFENLICLLMYSSDELRSQAESLFNLAKQTDPNTLSLKLAHHLHYCPPLEVRTISTVLLPKLLTRDDCPRLAPQTQPSFKPVLLTSIQQAQFAMVLGPDPSHFETLISHLMSSSNDLRSQAGSLFSLAKQTDPSTVSLRLAHHLHFCPPEELRTRCAILLPKLLTRGDSYIYPRFTPQTQTNLKLVLLASIQREETKTITKKLCDEEEDENDAGNMEDDVDNVSKLQKSQRYKDIMQKVEDALQKDSDISYEGMVFEDDPEYQLIVDCNPLSIEIENEIMIIHNFIRRKYHVKFPELESLVRHPIDYARVVKKIGNEVDMTLVDLEGLLPSVVIMGVSVTASTTSGKPLPEEDLNKIIDACDRALALDSAKKKVLDFVESRMGYIAPNLSAVVGSMVAAKLMGAVGLSTLARMPPCNVQLIGVKKRTSARTIFQFPGGYIEQTEVFQTTPPYLRSPVWWALAEKSSLAARVDSTRGDPSGNTGRALREEIQKKIEKWQEPPLPLKREPLPVKMKERYATMDARKLANRMPPAKREPLPMLRMMKEMYATMDTRKLANRMPPAKREPLAALREMKKRYATTEMRKLANKMQFDVPEESSSGDGPGEGYGSQNCHAKDIGEPVRRSRSQSYAEV